ncbi:MAG: hypothetical protein IPM61_16340 [Chlorobi bacterium]|nr:hypothetical protein [Chlorobiota bacterium]
MIRRNWTWLVGALLLASCVSKPMEQKGSGGPAAESIQTTSVAKPPQPSTTAAAARIFATASRTPCRPY